MLTLPVSFSLLLGCAPERPDYINRSTHKEGSPTVLIVGKQKTTRDDIEKEIQAMPIWLQTRFDGADGSGIFAQSLLSRGLLFRAALKEGIDKDPSVMKRYEANVLDNWLRLQTLLPPPNDDERRQYLATDDGRQRFQTRDVFQIVVATKSQADALVDQLRNAPTDGRQNLFAQLAARYSLDPTITWDARQHLLDLADDDAKDPDASKETPQTKVGLVASVSRNDYAKISDPEPPTWLENPPIVVSEASSFVEGRLGPLNLDADAWDVQGPIRNAVMWKVYLLGPWHDVNDALKDPDVVAKIDERVLLQRRHALVEKIAGR